MGTGPRSACLAAMGPSRIWLLTNARSGSNTADTLDTLRDLFDAAGIEIARTLAVPDDPLPTPAELDAAGIECIAIFTGDGTINAAVTSLYGWKGAILVLPGGTKNLLSQRLHGDATTQLIIERIGSGAARAVRPSVVRCQGGDALAGLLVGPGTTWASVREALRDRAIGDIAQGASEAVAESTGGAMVHMRSPARGRAEGYPLIELTPSHRGIQVEAYHADCASELVRQGLAILKMQFRDGPHTRLGLYDELHVESDDGQPLNTLLDGEQLELPHRAKFVVAPCEVDLLATDHGF